MSKAHVAQLTKKLPVSWWRSNGLVLGLIGAVALAFLWPLPGARGGVLYPGLVDNGGIALILFLQGVSLAFEKIKSGLGNWRLHLLVQAYTFVVFPFVGLGLAAATTWWWPGAPAAIRDGLLYLCVLPSTISTSVVFTAAAYGNTSGALFNAAFSNIIGVVVTPLLVQLLMQRTGQRGSFGPLLFQIALLTLVPFVLGMLVRPKIYEWVDARKVWVTRISNTVVLFIVYTAFCGSVEERIWTKNGVTITLLVITWVLGLFSFISLLVYASCRVLRLGREDFIAAYFCSVKKTLAMGVPLAALIFGDRPDLPFILMPVVFYHLVQLFCNGLLANYWGQKARSSETG